MEQVKKKEHDAMSLAPEFASLSHVNARGCGLANKQKKKKEETAFDRSCAAPQLMDRAFFNLQCVRSLEKTLRGVTRFV